MKNNILQTTDYFNNATYPNDVSLAINDEIRVSKSPFHNLNNLIAIGDPSNTKNFSATTTNMEQKIPEYMVFHPSLLKLNNTSTLELNEPEQIINLQGEQKHNVPASNE